MVKKIMHLLNNTKLSAYSLILYLFGILLLLSMFAIVFTPSAYVVVEFLDIDYEIYFKYLYITSVIISFIQIIKLAFMDRHKKTDINIFLYWLLNIVLGFALSCILGPIIFLVIIVIGIKSDLKY